MEINKQITIELTNENNEQVKGIIIEKRERTTLFAIDTGDIELEIVELDNNSFNIVESA